MQTLLRRNLTLNWIVLEMSSNIDGTPELIEQVYQSQ